MKVQYIRKGASIFTAADEKAEKKNTHTRCGVVVNNVPEQFPSVNAAKRWLREKLGWNVFRASRTDRT